MNRNERIRRKGQTRELGLMKVDGKLREMAVNGACSDVTGQQFTTVHCE